MEKEETVRLSPLKEPELKKQKMSTTSTSDGEEHGPTTAMAGDGPMCTRAPRYKRRKVAIFFAYCGVGYQGMQKNPGAKTIEGDLEAALYQVGAVPENEKHQPRRYDWARSARTDKGVSAVGQVVSGKFYIDPPGFVERLNSTLSHQIQIFGFKRVTASFNAKKFCDKRRYVYLIPVFALDPYAHRDRESVLASLGSGRELVKCLECSERGRKVFGIMGKRYQFDPKTEPGILSNSEDVAATDLSTESNMVIENGASSSENVGSETELGILSNNGDASIILQNADSKVNIDASDLIAESNMVTENGASVSESVEERNEEVVKESVFCYGEKERERFNRILKYYEGTHNFHNFTTRTKAEDPAAKRYIISFTADTVVNVEGIDFVKCEVIGQSFMLHQIRKMIGLAVAIMRNCSPESLIQTAFRRDVNINVPMAPEVGLYLDECFFTSYNKKWNDTHEEVSMKAYAEEAEEFKMKHIYSHIASTEHKDGTVALWLHSLNYRNYPDLRVVNNAISACSGDITEAVEAAVEVGLGTDARNAEAGHGADLVNTGNVSGVCEGSEVVQTAVETGLGAVNDGESTTARNVNAGHDADLVNSDNVSGVCDGSEVVVAAVETGVGAAINNGESTDARNVEAGHDADLVN